VIESFRDDYMEQTFSASTAEPSQFLTYVQQSGRSCMGCERADSQEHEKPQAFGINEVPGFHQTYLNVMQPSPVFFREPFLHGSRTVRQGET